jgi:hypothetical protein
MPALHDLIAGTRVLRDMPALEDTRVLRDAS